MNPANKWLLGVAAPALIAGVALWEGTRYTPYYDLAGVLTVCSGYTGKDIDKNKIYSSSECKTLLRKEVIEHANGVLNCVKAPLKENQYNAFVLMAYNVGVSGFCSSRALRLFNEGRTKEACRAIAYSPSGTPVWSFVRGRFIQGLHNRRLYEMNTCLGVSGAIPS